MSWLRDYHNLYFKYAWETWNISVSKKFVIFSLMVPVVEFLWQKHFQPNFKVYIDDKCTVYKQISYLRLSVNTTGLILLWYMSVVLGILFWEFKLQNIMSWLRDNDKILKIYLENVRYYGQVILWRSSLTCFNLVLKQSGRKNFVIFSLMVKTLSFEFLNISWWFVYILQTNIWFGICS